MVAAVFTTELSSSEGEGGAPGEMSQECSYVMFISILENCIQLPVNVSIPVR